MGKIMNYATEWEFKLGEEVEDTITKFKGMVKKGDWQRENRI